MPDSPSRSFTRNGMRATPLKRTPFKQKAKGRDELPKELLKRLAEQHLINPVEYGLTRPRRKPMQRVPGDTPGTFLLKDRYGRLWPWSQVQHLSEKDYDGTLLEWGYKRGKMLEAWHCYNPSESRKGWPDWVYLFEGFHVISENKVRDKQGNPPAIPTAQSTFLTVMALAGLNVRQWTHPDDTFDAWVTLTRLPVEECPYWSETRAA